jgi:hypothetical protein
MTQQVTERNYGGEFLISEANGHRSREAVTVAINQTLKAGRILGVVSVGALSVVAASRGPAGGAATGNGVITGATVAAGSKVGAYIATCIKAVTNLGVFMLVDPTGVELGEVNVATAFTLGGITATIADGATDWVVGDEVVYTVSAAAATDNAQYKGCDPAATDGSQSAAGILWDDVTTTSATVKATAVVRSCEVEGALLDYGSMSSPQKVTANAQLKAIGIIVR